jgi:1-hydroxycarotenoid 3,4-desaturase
LAIKLKRVISTRCTANHKVIVVGAGAGGLSSRDLGGGAGSGRHRGRAQPATPGGKMRRSAPLDGRQVDAGPTVLTMRWVFERLFEMAGGPRSMRAIKLQPGRAVLARHGWSDGSQLDLFADIEESARAIEAFL